ncbi:cytochrome-c peroxidase [Belliella kenyensis]|uniref:Cytochrome-c peroxidase n=1 Tax=Belliella kenyensis TaxID=1472724 RepID=A0ABV8ETF8_9BACT|nr:cytochrome c peroxidase [Belliella kenyensis]MCH7402200.1 cytochrome-c peroxidase [Belliella kenyensis]MDN3601715.1 cytochrome c peroxidase [Belliella kenyensis]
MKSLHNKVLWPSLLAILLIWMGCEQQSEKPIISFFQFEKPPHFPEPTYTFRNNEVNEKGFNLGKMLFFDPSLSRDGSVACSSCHVQSHAFADTWLHPFSFGVEDREGKRNAPPLFNLAFHREFFWDGGVTHLDFAPILAFESEIEMDISFEDVVGRIQRNDAYKALFKEVFGIEEVTGPYVLHALSQFMLMMVSADSRYDQYILGDQQALSAVELEGLVLFRQHCESCHREPLFTDLSYRNNGVQRQISDLGRETITEVSEDRAKFKVPSLRNIEVTSPYMHNARFEGLLQVLNHYTQGVQDQENIDPLIFKDGKPVIQLSEDEKTKIIAFLKSLTDNNFLSNPIFFNSNDR